MQYQLPVRNHNPPIVAPLTGTLRYPATGLIDLGRLILVNYQSHLKVELATFDAAYDGDGDNDARWDVKHSLEDVMEVMWMLDRRRWLKEEQETARARGGEFPEYSEEALGLDDPKQEEKSLLTMGMLPKAEYVIPDAVKLRKEQRGDPPEGSWKHEDALLNLLEFISKHANSGLFHATED